MGDQGRRALDGTISGAIVAGGRSTRFGGQPKGLVTVDGIRIVDRVAMALRRTVRDISLIANDPDSADWLPGVPVRADDREERGGLVGLHTAIRHVRGDVLVVAWDMPFVSADLLRLIVETGSGVAGAVVPEGPRGLEPMCALYSPACLPAIDRALDDGELRLSSVVARLPALVRVPIDRVRALGDPERLFFNVNTPRDLELAEVLARSE